jgi:hypothetical protein
MEILRSTVPHFGIPGFVEVRAFSSTFRGSIGRNTGHKFEEKLVLCKAIVICETLLGERESDFSGCENKAEDGVPQLWLEQSAPFHAARLF